MPFPPVCLCPRVSVPRLSNLRAIVEINRRSPLTLVVTGRNISADAWFVRCKRPSPELRCLLSNQPLKGSAIAVYDSQYLGQRGNCNQYHPHR